MKYLALIGMVSGLANMFIHYNNNPAFLGWLAATAWATCLFTHHLATDK